MSAPAVAVFADGKKFAAAWKDKRTGEPNVFWTVSDKPSFSGDELLHDSLAGDQNHPSLAIDSAGTLWAAWEDQRSHLQRIWVRASADGDAGRAISDEREGKAGFPVVAAGGKTVAVVYESKNAAVFRRLQ